MSIQFRLGIYLSCTPSIGRRHVSNHLLRFSCTCSSSIGLKVMQSYPRLIELATFLRVGVPEPYSLWSAASSIAARSSMPSEAADIQCRRMSNPAETMGKHLLPPGQPHQQRLEQFQQRFLSPSSCCALQRRWLSCLCRQCDDS